MDTQIVKSALPDLTAQILASILKQGGSEEDINLFTPEIINEFAGRAALYGINSRSTNKVYRLKPVNNLYEVEDHLFIHERLRFQIGNHADKHRYNDLWPIHPLSNEAYCELIKITAGDKNSMLAQIEATGLIPAEINYLLELAQHDVLELVKSARGRLITTIDSTNHFDDDRYHTLVLEEKSSGNRSSHGNKTQLDFLEEGMLERNYSGDEILVLVRRKDLIPV